MEDLWKMLEEITHDLEQSWQQLNATLETMTEDVDQTVEFLTNELPEIIVIELEELAQEVFNYLFEPESTTMEFRDWETDTEIDEEQDNFAEPLDLLFNPKVEATPNHHPACVGCCHYHGRVYSGNLLVCGMHPYGYDGDSCPDWQDQEDRPQD